MRQRAMWSAEEKRETNEFLLRGRGLKNKREETIMHFMKKKVETLCIYVSCLLLACALPVSVYADDTPVTTEQNPGQTTTTEQPPTTTEPTQTTAPPTTEQPATSTPTTTTETPPTPKKTYYYDSTSNRWNTDQWQYDPTSGTYKAPPPPVVVEPQTSTTSTGAIDAKTTVEITNALDSLATTGNASVDGNTKGGSATSGNASATATILNNVNSSLTNANNTEAASFVSNVMGDVKGDIILQPMLLKAMLEANASQQSQTAINSTNKTAIQNDITMGATSGNAAVTNNTKGGSATTGDANTVVDVVNIVNSMIAANQSFIGTINIYGNLDGDILIAPDFIPKLLASNGDAEASSATEVNSTNTTSIVNNVSLAAESGQALVEKNTSGGSATSGNADTNLVIFNLTGHDIVASNSLLVFINVLGKWVGVIVDAPAGTTAAAVGNNVTKNTQMAPDLVINATNETQITNNIDLASQTGNATVSGNTSAGNATTGNATASANIANISGSQLGLTGWFGVLFINVYGSWLGSFGVDTSAGEMTAATPSIVTKQHTVGVKKTQQVVTFVPKAYSQQAPASTTVVTPTGTSVLAASPAQQNAVSDIPAVVSARHSMNVPLAVVSLIVTLVSLYALRRFLL